MPEVWRLRLRSWARQSSGAPTTRPTCCHINACNSVSSVGSSKTHMLSNQSVFTVNCGLGRVRQLFCRYGLRAFNSPMTSPKSCTTVNKFVCCWLFWQFPFRDAVNQLPIQVNNNRFLIVPVFLASAKMLGPSEPSVKDSRNNNRCKFRLRRHRNTKPTQICLRRLTSSISELDHSTSTISNFIQKLPGYSKSCNSPMITTNSSNSNLRTRRGRFNKFSWKKLPLSNNLQVHKSRCRS